MNKPHLTLWHIPMDVVPQFMTLLESEVCTRVSLGQYEQAEDTLYCLQKVKAEYDKELAEYERLTEPDPEEEGDEDE